MSLWYDDVEYGLRNRLRFITLPGVSVWHHSSDGGGTRPYYAMRNSVITSLCTGSMDREDRRAITRSFGTDIAAYRYQFAEDKLSAIKDVLRGPDHVFTLCRDGLFNTRIEPEGSLEDLRSEIDDVGTVRDRGFRRRALTLNGLFLPSIGDIETTLSDMDSSHFYRVRRVLYRIDEEEGFIAYRRPLRSIGLTVRALWMRFRLSLSARRLQKEYGAAMPKYTSESFWDELFEDSRKEL